MRTTVEVVEVPRTGQPVRTAWFLASRVVAIVEHPMDDEAGEERPRVRRVRAVPDNQASLGIDG